MNKKGFLDLDLDLDWNVAGIAVLIWVVFMFAVWKLPEYMGTSYPFSTKLILTVALLPISYIITSKVNGD